MKRFLQQCKQNTEACAWVLSAVIVLVYGNGRFDLITVLLHHPDVWRKGYLLGLAGMGTNLIIFFYLTIWKPVLRLSAVDSEHQPPVIIQIGTAAGIVGGIGFTAALWPVWSWFTPVILFVLFMGFIMSVQLLPSSQSHLSTQADTVVVAKQA